jgi:hypothetical protein
MIDMKYNYGRVQRTMRDLKMNAMTFDQILHAAEQLTPAEQQALIEQLEKMRQVRKGSILDVLPLDNVGPWPEDLSLRREDMYEDER